MVDLKDYIYGGTRRPYHTSFDTEQTNVSVKTATFELSKALH